MCSLVVDCSPCWLRVEGRTGPPGNPSSPFRSFLRPSGTNALLLLCVLTGLSFVEPVEVEVEAVQG